jgi:hypothetical protein
MSAGGTTKNSLKAMTKSQPVPEPSEDLRQRLTAYSAPMSSRARPEGAQFEFGRYQVSTDGQKSTYNNGSARITYDAGPVCRFRHQLLG